MLPQLPDPNQTDADKAASAFITLAAHQLKTPIAELKGYVESIASGTTGPLSEKQTYYLEQMHGVCERAFHLIDNLLDISQIEQGIITMNLTPVDPHELVDEVLRGFEREVNAKGLAIRVDPAPSEVIVFADPMRTGEVLKNIINNAIKFTDKGAVTITIGREGSWGTITVADTGVGISEAARKDLFRRVGAMGRPFMSGQGAGLGLYVANQFASFEDGSITLLPSEAGAVFEVKLPLFTAKTPLGKKVRPDGPTPEEPRSQAL